VRGVLVMRFSAENLAKARIGVYASLPQFQRRTRRMSVVGSAAVSVVTARFTLKDDDTFEHLSMLERGTRRAR
jgi:hypothetical protein